MTLRFENELAEAEDLLRESGHNIPLAWGLGFLLDNQSFLEALLASIGRKDLSSAVNGICAEIEEKQ